MQFSLSALKVFIIILAGFMAATVTFEQASAQDLSRVQQLRDQMPNHYSFVRTGEPSMNVVVIGSVVRPGTYELRIGTDLNELFLYTGGPAQIGTRSREMSPDVNIFLSRPTASGEGRRIIFETTFEAYRNMDVEFPELQDLDMIIVETDPVPPALWREILSVGSQILSIATSVILLIWRFNRL